MPTSPHRVHVEAIHWPTLVPSLCLFRSFRQALHPSKLVLALVLVVLLFVGGKGLDVIIGPRVYEGEVETYAQRSHADYVRWLGLMDEHRLEAAEAERPFERRPIFDTLLNEMLDAFNGLVVSAMSLDLGLRGLLAGDGARPGGVVGALGRMIVVLPGWLVRTHPLFLAVYLLYAYVLFAAIGGAIVRMCAGEACRDLRLSPVAAMRYASGHYPSYFAAPLVPLGVALAIGLGLMVAGFVLFNLPVLDIVGGLLFGPLLLGGFVVALALFGLVVGFNLLYPAVAVDGADAFDANSRAFNYVFGRPWRYVFYFLVALLYGALAYLLVGFLIYLTIVVTKTFVGLWVGAEVSEGVTRFDAMLPDPRPGNLRVQPRDELLTGTAQIAGTLIGVWIKLLIAVLPAFWFSYYFCAQTWIYLLMRQASDGTAFDDLYLDDADEQDADEPPFAASAVAPVDDPQPPSPAASQADDPDPQT